MNERDPVALEMIAEVQLRDNLETFTFHADRELLEGVQMKAEMHDLDVEEVIRRFLVAWYYDLIQLPTPERGVRESELSFYDYQAGQVREPRTWTRAELEKWRQEGAEIFADVDPDEFAATIARWRQEG